MELEKIFPRAHALVIAERQRQIDVEGWSSEHDDGHTDGSLYKAAGHYLAFDPARHNPNVAPAGWPWDEMWWKPRSRKENLVRAGALCLAEKDRLVRRNLKRGHTSVASRLTEILSALEEIEVLHG